MSVDIHGLIGEKYPDIISVAQSDFLDFNSGIRQDIESCKDREGIVRLSYESEYDDVCWGICFSFWN